MAIETIPVDWPDITPWTAAGFIVFIILVAVMFVLMRRYYRLKLERDMCWFKLLSFAHKKSLSIGQINMLKEFYTSLEHEQCQTVVNDTGRFKAALFDYLDSRRDIKTADRVELIKQLFNTEEDERAVSSLDDLYDGEPCSLEYDDIRCLGRIIQFMNPYVLVYVPGMKGDRSLRGHNTRLNIYRPGTGGYSFDGSIYQTGDESIYFKHHGPVEVLHEKGMLVDAELLFELTIWPEMADMPKKGNKTVKGITGRISERNLSFVFNSKEDFSLYKKNRNEIWQLTLPLSEEQTFYSRGRVVPPGKDNDEENYFFKYIDVSESNYEKLFNFLIENNPRREQLILS